MIDLETMGSGSNAAIVAIGAVKFDKRGTREIFYKTIKLESSVSFGLDIDADTVMWWLKQNDEARRALTEEEGETLNFALSCFNTWVGDDPIVWGNGSDFDNVILANAYKKTAVQKELPWKFWNNRCYRTMKSLYRDVKMERKGTHHNALDDAISQAEHLIAIAVAKNIEL